jgi:AraC-like DNA-binding protein
MQEVSEMMYEFVELDTDESFHQLGKAFGGVFTNGALQFNTDVVNGMLLRSVLDHGLWIRKWKFAVAQKIVLRKMPAAPGNERKFCLIYFLNPGIFGVRSHSKDIQVNSYRNNMFLSNDAMIDFSAMPKQEFYVFDISFTASWLTNQFKDADRDFLGLLHKYINGRSSTVLLEPCSAREFKTLHEIELSMIPGNEELLFIRSRTYNLIVDFFSKVFNRKDANLLQTVIHYDQITRAERLIMSDIRRIPKIETIAREVNLSNSSLLRQFKLLYGKRIYEYHTEKKMELAKMLLLEKRLQVKEIAHLLGYKQVSQFIKIFAKHHGNSPGTVKCAGNETIF